MALALPRRSRRTAPAPAEAMTLVEHLDELRSRVMKALLALALGAVIGFLLYNPVLERLVQPYCDVKLASDPTASCRLVVTDPLESFSIRLKLSMYLGLMISLPFILWQLWRFITPGLHKHERRYAVPFVLTSTLLFVLGAALAIWTFPKTLEFFSTFGGEQLELLYTPSKYLGLLTMMMLIFGLGFEFPVLLVALQAAGVLTWQRLVSWRRYAIVGIVVVDAVITPSGDPITLLAMAVPMILFYEASILVGRFVLRR
jgi:sec-independent protein translocase protein TatC